MSQVGKDDFVLYMLAIKQAFENQTFSGEDCGLLRSFFLQGAFYEEILGNKAVCDATTLGGISKFCKMIEENLPAPVINGDVSFNMHLKDVGAMVGAAAAGSLLTPLQRKSEIIFKAVAVNLMSIFQCAILDLTADLNGGKAMSVVDVENVNYVIGMAQITSQNLGNVISAEFEGDHQKIQKFLTDAVGFAGSLRRSGMGMMS